MYEIQIPSVTISMLDVEEQSSVLHVVPVILA